ncbi:LOW QUALITY PROTEIN: hypothetical protein PanWU01x14_135960 [Parasponia andersonii]|uniref:Uncharacterized protein n=1 Tax=Parasponia andersonii TaxID=3476 RepID=A0A2P5CPE2_PARAD|nr:LOW QUALITY PROTEIN: hypothetical protein PanWU01x14_135960 [Parasponia andersonii]
MGIDWGRTKKETKEGSKEWWPAVGGCGVPYWMGQRVSWLHKTQLSDPIFGFRSHWVRTSTYADICPLPVTSTLTTLVSHIICHVPSP